MATILALGAWLKNTACLRRGDGTVCWSGAHGDLGTPQACAALEASAAALLERAGGRVDAVAHDLHPDFHSTRLAQRLAARLAVPAIAVQHHHAHIGAVLAEHALAGPAIGIALDGVGLGSDATAWGGELLRVDGARWRRVGHLQPLALPGGDVAAREPWRMAAAALHALGRGDEIEAHFAAAVGATAARVVARMLARQVNCPVTTSAGRWFDAAAGALGLSVRQAHEAQAAIALQACAQDYLAAQPLPPAVELHAGADGTIDLRPLFAQLFAIAAQVDRALPERAACAAIGAAAALFHATLAAALARAAAHAAASAGTRVVALGGGCLLNPLLAARLEQELRDRGCTAWRPRAVPCGDAGLALGQAWVAQQQLEAGVTARATEDTLCA